MRSGGKIMKSEDVEKRIIEQYQKDERMMILIFAQWCINHDVDPIELYKKAYPNQGDNQQLTEILELTVPKEEAGEIADQTLLDILSAYGNEDLAFVVADHIEQRKRKK